VESIALVLDQHAYRTRVAMGLVFGIVGDVRLLLPTELLSWVVIRILKLRHCRTFVPNVHGVTERLITNA